MSSTWKIGGEVVRCVSVNIGVAQTDSASADIINTVTSIVDGAWVSLTCDGAPVLWGRARVSQTIEGATISKSVTINGPWEVLEKTVYQQGVKVRVPHAVDTEHPYGYALGDVLSPEVTLGMADDGTPRNTFQEAQSIMTYAAAAGVPVAWDPGFSGLPMRPRTLNGSSCTSCLMAVLRFHPDVVLVFDYSSGLGATLKAVKVSDMVATSYPGPGGSHVVTADFKKRLNYKPDGIRIIYQRTSVDGRIEIQDDTAGTIGTEGRAPGVINWLINLEGATPPPILTQKIRTCPIPHSDNPEHPEEDETEGKMNWWQSKLDWLNLPGVAELVTIEKHRVIVDKPNITPSEDPDDEIEDTWSTDPDDYPRELVDGTIPDWRPEVAAPLTIRAQFVLATVPDDMPEWIVEELKAVFGRKNRVKRKAQVTGTDATTREYAALASYPDPPPWPAPGLAADYMESFDVDPWAGSMTLVGDSQPIARPGTKVNVAGYHSAWSSMGAVVQSVDYSPEAHTVKVRCAPPGNFGIGDFYELQQAAKKMAGSDERAAADRRTQALPNSGGRVRGGRFTSNRSVSNDDEPSGGDIVPWQCERDADFTLKVWPAPMFDGRGHSFWPTIGMTTTAPETPYTFEFAEDAGDGNLYVECTVDDTDEVHGLITAAALKLDFDTHEFNELESGKVKI
ncbi:MAG: hypothetical protein V4726_07370, partial [Verrucomicrobiota bacterium]